MLRFAEMLNPDGTIYTTNLRAARCTDTYILNGKGLEIWEPRFTYHGFRYVEVTGYPGKPGARRHYRHCRAFEYAAGRLLRVLQSDGQPALQQYSLGPARPTSSRCRPTARSGMNGWAGPAMPKFSSARRRTIWMCAAFFTKWLVDLEDAQTKEGAFPDVAPRKVAMGDGVAAWGDAGVICPWTIYQVYGDKRVIRETLRINEKVDRLPAKK